MKTNFEIIEGKDYQGDKCYRINYKEYDTLYTMPEPHYTKKAAEEKLRELKKENPITNAAAALGSIKSAKKSASSRENGKGGGRKSLLRRACENNYGFLDVTPGTDIAGRLGHVSESSITKYIKNGWVKKIGSGLVLTHDGYNVL
ncbi:MAG: hypothetical protein ABFD59_09345 [Smithella sp.]